MKSILVLVFLFSVPSFALEIVLDRTNHSGFRLVNVLKVEKGQYSIDGKSLGKNLPVNIQNIWNQVAIGPTISKLKPQCASGNYVFVKKEKNKEVRRRGCTDGQAYGQLIYNIEALRTYAKGI